MMSQLNSIKQEALKALQAINSKELLENWRTTYLAKKSPLMTVLGNLGQAVARGTSRDRQAGQRGEECPGNCLCRSSGGNPQGGIAAQHDGRRL